MSRKKIMNLFDSVFSLYPGSIIQSEFFEVTSKLLNYRGFFRPKARTALSCCRDEIATDAIADASRYWGPVFSLDGLAGFPFCGKTAFEAFLSHDPIVENERYAVLYGFSHISIGDWSREGMPEHSPVHACGALHKLISTIDSNEEFKRDDFEMSMLRLVLVELGKEAKEHHRDFPKLTEIASLKIAENLKTLASKHNAFKYAICCGIQIHAHPTATFILPTHFSVYCTQSNTVNDLLEKLKNEIIEHRLRIREREQSM